MRIKLIEVVKPIGFKSLAGTDSRLASARGFTFETWEDKGIKVSDGMGDTRFIPWSAVVYIEPEVESSAQLQLPFKTSSKPAWVEAEVKVKK